MDEASSNHNSEHSFFGDEMDNIESDQNKNQINYSQNSSNIERVFDTVNKKIKYLIENGKDLSYSNSNSKISDQFQNKEQFLYSRYWCVKKKNSNEKSIGFIVFSSFFGCLPESREPKRHREKPQPRLDAHGRHLKY